MENNETIIKQDEPKTYRTTQLALCPYLEFYGKDKGIQFLRADVVKDRLGRIKIEFVFSDIQNAARDLELEYRHSDVKKMRDLLFYYKKIISEKLGLN